MRTLVALLSLVTLMHSTATAGPFVFTSFRGSGDGLHLAYSEDGREWVDLEKTFLTPTVGARLLRDPNILLGPNGVYHMVWTTGWHDLGIGHATSNNLIEWSAQQFLPLMAKVQGAKTCWAPELYRDGDRYVIVWSSNVESGGIAKLRAYFTTTTDFVTFAEPKVLFDPGFDNLDTTIVRAGDKFVAVFKQADDQQKKIWGPIWLATSAALTGPYAVRREPIVTNQQIEGPALVALGDRTLLYADYYVDHKYGVWETADFATWRDVTNTTAVIDGQRHGSILAVPAHVLATLRKDEPALIASVPAPILDGFTADPSIRCFGDRYYVYPTSDRPHWQTTDFSVWSSSDLIDWRRDGMILDVATQLSWAKIKAWAPDCIERDGKFYFYFCADGMIGVGVSDQPTGPFADALGRPLLVTQKSFNTNTIDPNVFIDDDGQAYLYFGNGAVAQAFKLKPDMITLDGEPTEIKLRDFREGIWVFKRGGKYYFTWSIDDARSPDYRVGYGVADSPLGPVTSPADFIVLKKNGRAVGTAHHSILNVPGTDRWYLCYHRHAVPGGSGYKRQTCLARMNFGASGAILPVDPLSTPFAPGDVGEPLVDGKGRPDAR